MSQRTPPGFNDGVRVAHVNLSEHTTQGLQVEHGCPGAPGTMGTLLAIPIFPALGALRDLSVATYLLAVALILVGSVWVAGPASEELGERNSPRIVIDEVAGYVAATGFLDFSWLAAAVAS